jgi:tripartite ATP-independent transporter DctM subunit
LDPLVVGILAVVAFLLLVSQAVPIAFSFAIVGCLGLILFRGLGPGLTALGSVPFTWASAQMIIPVPLFILMGFFAYVSAISQDLYQASHRWLGKFPGGIAMATTAASSAFAACCGAVPAAAATMSTIAFPEMKKLNYDRRLATGCISAGATISILIPPSVPFIIYSVLTETSVADLFIAGIILTVLFLAAIYVMCKRNPQLGPPGPSFTWRERFVSLKGVWGMMFLFVLVIGGLYFGIFTPTEAGAIGAFGAFVISLATRRLTLSKITAAAKETVRITSFVVALIIGAQIFNMFLGVTGITTAFASRITALSLPPYAIMASIIIIYLILGMFLDIMAVFLLTIPTLAPIIAILGFDLVWFGVIVVLLAQIGFLTPPVGMCSYIVQGVTKVPLEEIFRGAIPFVVMMIVCIGVLLAFPQIALFLPSIGK